MQPVYQTKFGDSEGNCMAACLASLLGCPIDSVPDLTQSGSWLDNLDAFLNPYGLAILWIETGSSFLIPHGVHYMIWGNSPRGIPHSVIGYEGKIVHDPHPEGGGISKVEHTVFLVKR